MNERFKELFIQKDIEPIPEALFVRPDITGTTSIDDMSAGLMFISKSMADKMIADMWLTTPPLYGIPICDIIIPNEDLRDLLLHSIGDDDMKLYNSVNLLVIGSRGKFYLIKDITDQVITGMIDARGYDLSKLTPDRLDEFYKSIEGGSIFIDLEK